MTRGCRGGADAHSGALLAAPQRGTAGDFLSQVRSIAGPGPRRGSDAVSLKPSAVQAQGPGTRVKAEKCILAEEAGGRHRVRETALSGETGGFRVSRDDGGGSSSSQGLRPCVGLSPGPAGGHAECQLEPHCPAQCCGQGAGCSRTRAWGSAWTSGSGLRSHG